MEEWPESEEVDRLREAWAGERANAEHLRRLARQQTAASDDLRRRWSVRVALAIDRRAQPIRARISKSLQRTQDRASALAQSISATPARFDRSDRLRRLAEAGNLHASSRRPVGTTALVVLAPEGARKLPVVTGDPSIHLVVPDDAPVSVEVDSMHTYRAGTSSTLALAAAFAASDADFIGFLHHDVSPMQDDWLTRLVDRCCTRTAAVGAQLVHPDRPPTRATPHDLLVRDRGLSIDVGTEGFAVAHACDAGKAIDIVLDDAPVDALSLSCLVVRGEAFRAIGGFPVLSDAEAALVSLCIRFTDRNHRVITTTAVTAVDDRPVHRRRGDVDLALDPFGDGWRRVVDLHGPALLRRLRPSASDHLRIAVTVAVPSATVWPQWGDWHLAHALARSLRRLGHSVRIQAADGADDPEGRSCDVHVVLRGLAPIRRSSGQMHVLWVFSHPEALDIDECHEADLVLVASVRFAEYLRHQTDTPVEVLEQATDHHRFRRVPPDPRYSHPVAIVANTRHVFRPMMADALAVGIKPAVYGRGWGEFVDDRLLMADHIDNEVLAILYSSVGLLLNDHWDTMRSWGFVSNRLFDVLACGTPVVSDYLPEISTLFGDSVWTYSSRAELAAHVEEILGDPVAARGRVAEGQRRVLEEHTFDHRAADLIEVLRRYSLA